MRGREQDSLVKVEKMSEKMVEKWGRVWWCGMEQKRQRNSMKGTVNERERQPRKTTCETADNWCRHLFVLPPTILSAWVFQDTVALLYLSDLHYRDKTLYSHTHTHKMNSLQHLTAFHAKLIVIKGAFSLAISGQGVPAAIMAKSPH